MSSKFSLSPCQEPHGQDRAARPWEAALLWSQPCPAPCCDTVSSWRQRGVLLQDGAGRVERKRGHKNTSERLGPIRPHHCPFSTGICGSLLGRWELSLAAALQSPLPQLEEELGWVYHKEEPEEDAGSPGGSVPSVRCLGSSWGKSWWNPAGTEGSGQMGTGGGCPTEKGRRCHSLAPGGTSAPLTCRVVLPGVLGELLLLRTHTYPDPLSPASPSSSSSLASVLTCPSCEHVKHSIL